MRRLSFGLVFLVSASCHRAPEPEGRSNETIPSPAAPASGPSAAPPLAAPASPETPKAHWLDPAGWTRVASTSSMRIATYRVPKARNDAEDGELSVFFFGAGKGGDVQANFQRWERQFSMVPQGGVRRSDRKAGDFPAHVLEIDRGTFTSGMPGEPPKQNSGYGLLGAIVETPVGNYFFKLTGSEKTVKEAHPAFFTLIDSVKVGAT